MGVSVSFPAEYGYDIASLFGVDKNLLNNAKMAGIKINPVPSNPLNFIVSAGGLVGTVVHVKGTALTLAKAGKMGPASKEALAGSFVSAIKTTLDMLPNGDKYFSVKDSPQSEKTEVYLHGVEVAVDYDPEESAPLDGSKLSLKDATACGQAVHGTSNGSTYYTAARLKGLNLAVRIKFNKMSVRAEGTDLNKYESALKDLGFKFGNGYASAHFEAGGAPLRTKTFGAIIGALGMEQVVEVVSVLPFVGKV